MDTHAAPTEGATPEAVAALLSELLRQQGISLPQASKLASIPLSTLRRRMAGGTPFSITELASLCRVVETSPSRLISEAVSVTRNG